MELTNKQKKEYEKFSNKQFEIIKGHFDRCMLRIYNKYLELLSEAIRKLHPSLFKGQEKLNKNGGKEWKKNMKNI